MLNLMLEIRAGTSPLEARGNSIIYLSLFIALIVIAIFGVICAIVLYRKKQMESPEWQEKEKARPTKYSDIERLATVYPLTKEQLTLLWTICKKYQIVNIYYSIKRFNDLDSYFKQAYLDTKKEGEEAVSKLFELKMALDRIFADSTNITSTAYLSKDTKTSLVLPDGQKVRCPVIENTKDYVALLYPSDEEAKSKKPVPLTKTEFTFLSPVGMPYAFITRVMRYEKRGDDTLMILSHSSDLVKKSRRRYKRINYTASVKFSLATQKVDNKGKLSFISSNTSYDGVLQNISGGGCCLSTAKLIEENNALYLSFNLTGTDCKVVGKIVKTRPNQNTSLFNLHIRFINIDLSIQNKILAKVYDYE